MEELVNAIFVKNRFNNEIRFEINQNMHSKDLAHFLYSLFTKGLILLFGYNNQLTLNFVTIDQIEKVIEKLKFAHVKTKFNLYDKETAVDLDYLPEILPTNLPLEIYVMQYNQMELGKKPNNLKLDEYVFKKYLNGQLICISFEIF